MTPRTHMQDQVHDRIKDIMGEKEPLTLEGLFHNLATLAIVVAFLMVGINW
jgi:hypothetical protein